MIPLSPRQLITLALAAFVAVFALSGALFGAPVTEHPRLLVRSADLPGLRARMNDNNDVWVHFRDQVVVRALADWKRTRNAAGDIIEPDGTVVPASVANSNGWVAAPEDDIGAHTGNQPMISEQYAMLFAFMAMLTKDDPAQVAQYNEYVAAAKECLFKVIDPASLGHPAPDAAGKYPPFRHPGFALQDRSFAQEAFGLTVDWIYDTFTPHERAKLRRTFLLWTADTWKKPYYSPINPNELINDPAILGLDTPEQLAKRSNLRIALNNHYANHLRQMTLYALAFDPQDDVPSAFADVTDIATAGSLTGYTTGPGGPGDWVYQNKGVLRGVTGSWLYLTDYALRHDGAGGLSLEGTQYASNGLGPLALTMLALHSAGQDDTARWGPQVSLAQHPFWTRVLPGYLAQLTPTSRVNSNPNYTYLGAHFQPPLTGDLESYAMINDQNIKFLAPLALHDWRENGTNGAIVQAVRYIQRHLAPGGTSRLQDRIRSTRSEHRFRDAIYYFLLFDPAAPAPADPRPAFQEKTFWAQYDPAGKMGMVLARSGSSPQDTYFQWQVGWRRIDHQQGDSLGFGLWKNGLWLTKIMTGYGLLQGCSDYRNAPALQNSSPTPDPYGGQANTQLQVDHGSQLIYESMGDPQILARSLAAGFVHFDTDATNLYNSYNRPEVRSIEHASRSILWLKPDIVVVYDRAKSTAGLWKRFYLNLPSVPTIAGQVATATASEGATPKAKLFVSSLLPLGATVASTDISSGQPSPGEDMKARLVVEAPGAPAEARFLHVVQGADPAVASADATQLIASTAGTTYDGAVVGSRAILFKREAQTAFASLSYEVPGGVTQHYVTGLAKFAPYAVTFGTAANGNTTVAIVPDAAGALCSDGGGVLVLGTSEPPRVEIKASVSSLLETSAAPVTFTVARSGDVSSALTLNLALDPKVSKATAADVSAIPASITIPAGASSATFDVAPVADAANEGPEDLVLALQPAAGIHIAEAGAAATVTLTEVAPNSGKLQFASAAFSVAENVASGVAAISVVRTGGFEGAVSVQVSATGGTAGAADFSAPPVTLAWAHGETAAKTFNVTIANDSSPESSETVTLTLTSPSVPGTLGSPASATLTITDDDSPSPPQNPPPGGGGSGGAGVISFAAATYNVTEALNPSATLTVTRTGGSAGAVSVGYYTLMFSAAHGTDYTYTTGSLQWADGDTSSRTITVPILDDDVTEPAEYFKVTLDGITGGATYGANQLAQVNIADDDIPPPVYQVGPGQPLASPAEVPWTTLPAGAKVRLHWQPAAYQHKILLSTRGTAAKPITLEGVPGPGGELPVIDGTGAIATAALNYTPWFGDVMERSIIAVARNASQPSSHKPGHIVIQNLELRMSGPATPMPTYVKPDGASASYYSTTGAIFLYGAENVTVRDCVIHDVPNGIVAASGSTEPTITRNVTVEYCWLYHAGKGGLYHGGNVVAEAVGLTVQFSRLGRGLNPQAASNLLDRSAGTIIRHNWIEGGAKLVDLIEPVAAPAIITADPAFAVSHVYGNVFVNGKGDSATDGSSVLRYGGDWSSAANFRQGTLHFHHNTLVVDSLRWQTTVCQVSLASATVLAHNNVLHHAKLAAAGGPFNLISSGKTITLGRNWLTAGYSLGGSAANGTALVLTGASPGFVDLAAQNFRPAANSPLIDAALALPAGAHPIGFQYVPEADGGPRTVLGAAADLGAFEGPN